MLKDEEVSHSSDWVGSGRIAISGFRDGYPYSIPRAAGKADTYVSPVIAASVEEKVSDLIQSYPHLEASLKYHAMDTNTRIRDLAISDQEREQLLVQVIAMRRQQAAVASDTRRVTISAHGSRARFGSERPRRKRLQ
jgi:hypothetical protein